MGIKRKPPPGNIGHVRSNGQNLCGVMTHKANRTVQFESFTERSLLLRLDRVLEVRDYASQPEQIHYADNESKTVTLASNRGDCLSQPPPVRSAEG